MYYWNVFRNENKQKGENHSLYIIVAFKRWNEKKMEIFYLNKVKKEIIKEYPKKQGQDNVNGSKSHRNW